MHHKCTLGTEIGQNPGGGFHELFAVDTHELPFRPGGIGHWTENVEE